MFARSRSLILPIFAMFMIAFAGSAVRGADAKTDASGTWKWSVPGKDGATREMTLNLTQDGDKLTGSMVGKNGNTDITDGSVKDGQVSFKLTRKRGDKEITSTFTGKLSGDSIEGTVEANGKSHDWKAARSKA